MTNIAFSGNTTGPVEIRTTQNGKSVGSVTVAVNRKRGEVEETDFHRVTLWESLAENAAQIDRGTRVVVIGRLTSREFVDKDQNKRTGWDVTADSFGPDVRFAQVQVTRTPRDGGNGRQSGAQGVPARDSWGAPSNDEMPF